MSAQRDYIEDIKNRQIDSDREFVLDSLTGAIDRLEKAFPRYGSFLMEFVQNADDAMSHSLKIEILQNTIKIFNDGLPFYEKDVKSICKVGRSSKTPKDYIGYLGVGFKAVFIISECPEIYSGGYQFKFDKDDWEDSEHIPWQVIPIWIQNPNMNLSEYRTIFNLPLKAPHLIEKLRAEVNPEQLNNRILLFLRNIREIEITDVVQELKRKIVKSEFSKTANYEIYLIQEYENDALTSQDHWLVFRSICDVPKDVKEDDITRGWERENIKKREILVAFKLDGENRLIKERKGTAHIGVFSFLPLKEIPSGLNFLVQADFLTAPGRGELGRDCLWNKWLTNEIYDLIVKGCIPTFLNHEKWKMNFTDVLYSSEGGHKLFEENVKIPLNEYLENNAVLIDEDGEPSKAEELILVEEEIKELLTDNDLNFLYTGKKIIHQECKPYLSLKIQKTPGDIHNFITSSESEGLIKIKAGRKEINWFKKLYSMFVDKYNIRYFRSRYSHYNVEHDQFWDRMRELYRAIILTNDFEVARIKECYINPKNIQVPEQLKDKFKIVHPQFLKDEKFKLLRRELNEVRYNYLPPETKVVKELNEEDIKNILRRQETLGMDEKKWMEISEKEKGEEIKEIKKLWARRFISLEGYNFLTLKSKDGEWVKPEKLVFSEEYKPEHSIEMLVKKGLIDWSLKFVCTEFIEDCINEDDKIRKWRRFFKELGVDKIVETKKEGGKKEEIIQRIGILTSLRYEKEKEREPRELGESEKPGYDIETKSKGDERFIEVKGTSDTSPEIFLTVNEFRALRNKKEKYFIYVVLDALRKPILYITQGDKLLGIEDVKVIIPFNKWKNLIDGEFEP